MYTFAIQLPAAIKVFLINVYLPIYLSIYLVTTVGTELVQDSSECAFKCLEKDLCLSFNLADLDDNIDNLLCELLPSDHYTHSDKFIANHLWYHYSIAVKLFSFFYFILSSRVFYYYYFILIIAKIGCNCSIKFYSSVQG